MKTLTALAVTLLVVLAAHTRAQYPLAMSAPDKIAEVAVPFKLQDVRLLDGPFKDAMSRDAQYLLSLDQDRLLHNFRVTAGLPSTAKPLGGWEAPDVELRGHAVGHYLSAVSIMYAGTGDERFKTLADHLVAEFAKVQAAESAKFHPGYLSAFPEEFFDRVEARKRVWAPYYTIHKIMAGLLDAYLLTGNAQALDVLKKQADWVYWRNARLTDAQRQAMLETEQGGMIEVLANLYAVTGAAKYLESAKMFEHKRILDPLAHGVDPLDNIHANTQIPKIIGVAREYELTGDQRSHDIASFFWDRVVHHRTFVMGGNSDDEAFFPEDQTSKHLGAAGPETCNTYNMLKLTRHLFSWNPTADEMDYYERALFNQILPSQDPKTGMVSYYCPLKPGAFRTWSTPDDSFWCCVGTGMENHAKYQDSIYFHSAGGASTAVLWVNLFIPSELTWTDEGLKIAQRTTYPEADTTSLAFSADQPVHVAVKVRYPAWAKSGMTVTVNGMRENVSATPGSYVTIERVWKSGDTLTLTLPISLHVEATPDDPRVQALLYGPIVLAGDLGTAGLDAVRRYGPSVPAVGRVPPIAIPVFVASSAQDLLSHIVPVAGKALTFQTKGLAQPHDVTLAPLNQTFEPRYTVYWTVYTPADYETHKAELATEAARKKGIDARTIDVVDVNSDASESAHAYSGQTANTGYVEGRRWRDAGRDGFLSYTLKVQADRPVTLLCTYRGSEGQRRTFDVLVDGQKIATETLEYHPTELLDREYAVTPDLTRGKSTITVKLVPHENARTGGVVEIRTVQPYK